MVSQESVLVCFVKPKTNIFGLFRFVSMFRTYIETFETNRTVSKKNETNRNKIFKKKLNMLSIKLFRLVFCLFRFNRNIETLYFGIEAKQPKLSRQEFFYSKFLAAGSRI